MTDLPMTSPDPRIEAVARVVYDRERASATLWSGLNDEEKEGWRAAASAFLAAADAVDPLRNDRPRVYSAIRIRHQGGGETTFAVPVTLIEWSREKVVPVMEAALRDQIYAPPGEWRPEVEAIFDALDRP